MKLTQQQDKLILSSQVEWWSRVIGIPFLLLGVLCMVSWLSGGMTDESGRQASFGVALLFSLPFGLSGLGFGFGQIKFIVDRRNGTATRWLGALFPFWKKTVPLSRMDRVSLISVQRRRQSHNYTAYAVSLSGPAGSVNSSSIASPHECRRLARRVAVFCELPLHDTLKDTTTPCSELAGNLRERLKSSSEKPVCNDIPPEGVSADRVGGTSRIRLEPAGLTFGRKLMLYVQLGGLSLLGLPLLIAVLATPFSAEAGLRPLALVWLIPLLGLAASGRAILMNSKRETESEEEIELTQSELVWKSTWRSKTTRKVVRVAELDDLENDWGGLQVLSESDSFSMARGVSRDTRDWLSSYLKAQLIN